MLAFLPPDLQPVDNEVEPHVLDLLLAAAPEEAELTFELLERVVLFEAILIDGGDCFVSQDFEFDGVQFNLALLLLLVELEQVEVDKPDVTEASSDVDFL